MKIRRFLAGLIVACLCSGCGQYGTGRTQNSPSTSGQDAIIRQQLEEHERQMELSKKQLEETERQLALSAKNLEVQMDQNKRFDELMQRWSAQADRVDIVIKKWEKLSEEVERKSDSTLGAP